MAPMSPLATDAVSHLADRGFARWPRLLPEALLASVSGRMTGLYDAVDSWLEGRGPSPLPAPLPERLRPTDAGPDVRYVPTADSLSLGVLGPLAEVIWSAAEATLGPVFAAEFGAGVTARRLAEHAWLRRQHPPGAQRPPRSPHGWHQDGGLGFDYLSGDATDGLLPMLTAWIPLAPCGRTAPGLRLDPTRRPALVPLDRLAAAQAATPRIETPALDAGEAVLMHGGTLHATASVGRAPRISVELRWLPGDRPLRL